MKSKNETSDLRAKSADELKAEVLAVRKEQFNLRMQAALGQSPKSHLVRAARKKIARIKTLLTQKAGA